MEWVQGAGQSHPWPSRATPRAGPDARGLALTGRTGLLVFGVRRKAPLTPYRIGAGKRKRDPGAKADRKAGARSGRRGLTRLRPPSPDLSLPPSPGDAALFDFPPDFVHGLIDPRRLALDA